MYPISISAQQIQKKHHHPCYSTILYYSIVRIQKRRTLYMESLYCTIFPRWFMVIDTFCQINSQKKASNLRDINVFFREEMVRWWNFTLVTMPECFSRKLSIQLRRNFLWEPLWARFSSFLIHWWLHYAHEDTCVCFSTFSTIFLRRSGLLKK